MVTRNFSWLENHSILHAVGWPFEALRQASSVTLCGALPWSAAKYPFHALSEDWERSPICHNQLLKDNISIEEVDVHMFAVLDVSLST